MINMSDQEIKISKSHELIKAGLKKRHSAETRFRILGLAAVLVALAALAGLFSTIIVKGYTAFQQTYITLNVYLDPEILDPAGTRNSEDLRRSNTNSVIKSSLRERFPEVSSRSEKRELYSLISIGASFNLANQLSQNPNLLGQAVDIEILADDDIDMLIKGHISADTEESQRRVSNNKIFWVSSLESEGRINKRFNSRFFTSGDSRNPEMAGILGAIVGSSLTLLVTIFLAFPVGSAAAIYLEEFAPKNRMTSIIEVNINNLAAVPSIVFGLLGMAAFLNFFGLPRSAPLVGGLVLALMTLPVIIISARASLASVPPSIREAALGVGASKIQMVRHHVLPLAMPGIMTGTIIGMARALGETAPLLMIGMVAFIVDIPGKLTDPSSALPVQIFLWSDAPERAFVEKTAAATMVLLGFLILMNALAVYLRKRFEVRY